MEIKLLLLQFLALESFVGSALVYFKKDNKTFSVSVLSGFLLIIGLIFLESFVLNYFGTTNGHPLIVLYSYLFFVLCLLLPPTFYIYVLSLVKTKREIFESHHVKWHYVPAVILLVINLFCYVALYNLEAGSQNYTLLRTVLTYCNFISLYIIFLLQNVFYIYFAWQFYFEERTVLKETQSKKSNLTLKWMRWYILLYTVLIVMLYLFQLRLFLEAKLVFRLFTLVYVSLIIFFGKNNYQFIVDNLKSETLDAKKRAEIKQALLAVMTKEQPHLAHDLTLKDLAHRIGTNSKYLSYIINREFDCNFSTFVNRYRVEEAKKVLSDPAHDIYTIESVAQKTGFKSKSTFNAVFKRETLLTPSQFKQQFKK